MAPHRGGRRWLLPLLLLTLLSSGCAEMLYDDYDYARVDVQARAEADAPVPGVRVVLYTGARPMAYAWTDPAGRHAFGFVPAGGYGIYVEPPEGFSLAPGQAEHVYLDLEEGDRRAVTIQLVQSTPE